MMDKVKADRIIDTGLRLASVFFVICGVIIELGSDDKIAEIVGLVSMMLGMMFNHAVRILDLDRRIGLLESLNDWRM